MDNKLFNIIHDKNRNEILISLRDDLIEAYDDYCDSSDFKAIILLKALQDLDLSI